MIELIWLEVADTDVQVTPALVEYINVPEAPANTRVDPFTTPQRRLLVVPDVCLVQVILSGEVNIRPLFPYWTYSELAINMPLIW